MRYLQHWFGREFAQLHTEELREFIAAGTPAGQNLVYGEPTADPGELSRQVTALANAEGGLLILGVEVNRETDAKGNVLGITPKELVGVDAREWTDEAMWKYPGAWAAPPVQGIKVYVHPLSHQRAVVYLDIPQSSTVHHATDGRYYIRRGFLNLPMDQPQTEALRARRGRPKLLPRLEISRIEGPTGRVALRLRLDNRGRREVAGAQFSLCLVGAQLLDGPPRVGAEGAPDFLWKARGGLRSGEMTGPGDFTIRHAGGFAATVTVTCEGLPPETTYFLIKADVLREVAGLLAGDEGWEVPPADRAEYVSWASEVRPQKPTSAG